ncbi:MAG: dodecin domain-containing protein [Chloroflexi bacterium]|nr:dodecin domain-containing protein [Chloroflexota bacterium]
MSPQHTYKVIELVGVSDQDVSAAIKNAVSRASRTLRGLDWFTVSEIRGLIQDGEVANFQVTLKVGFRLMSDSELGD